MDTEEAVAAPTADVSPTPVEEAPAVQAEESPAESEATTSMSEAFAQAKAELASDESTPAKGEDAPASLNPPETGDSEATPQTPAEPEPRRSPTAQGELDRIQTLIAQGREHELDPAARGVLRKLEEGVLAKQQKEDGFRKLYLDYETERFEDAEAFSDKMLADPGIAQFMQAYRRQHPGISLDNTTAQPRQPDPAEVRAQVDSEYVTAVTQVAEKLTRDHGVDEGTIARLQAESGGKVGDLLVRSFEAAVQAQVTKLTPEIARKEREAAELEAQAKYANKTIIVPRQINGLPVDPKAAKDSSEPFSMRDAFNQAKQEIAAG